MEKKDLEDLKERLENAEFNNYEEDLKVTNEEKKDPVNKKDNDFFEEKDKKKNMIIYALVALVIILLIIVLFFLLSGKNDNNNSTDNSSSNSNSNSSENNSNNNNETPKKIKEEDYNYSNGSVYYNRYVYVESKDKEKAVITDLEGNIITEVSNSKIYEGPENSIYLVNQNYKNDGNFDIKRIKDNIVHNIFKENATGLLIGKEKNNLLGVYKQNKDDETIYLFNGNEYSTINLDNYFDISNKSNDRENKYIYNNKYIITFDKISQEKYEDYGIYDIKAQKQVLKGTYEDIDYLHDDIFSAEKNNKSGIIDVNNKTLLNFNYDSIAYANGLYFVSSKDKISIYDANYNTLNKEILLQNSNQFELITFKDYVIVRNGNLPNEISDYIAVDKLGNTIPLGKGYIGFLGNYLVKSSADDTFIYMYDGALNQAHKINVGEKAINLNNINLFLNNTLVINNKNLYNLENDSSKGTTNWYRRVSEEFDVRIDFKGDKGKVTVKSNEIVLKELDDVSVDAFLKADNNGIKITKDYFIYNADGVIIIKRVPQNNPE